MKSINIKDLGPGLLKCKKAYLRVNGIKKRDRSVKSHLLDFGLWPVETQCGQLVEVSRVKITETMKSVNGSRFEISLQDHAIEQKDKFWIEHSGSAEIFGAKTLEVLL